MGESLHGLVQDFQVSRDQYMSLCRAVSGLIERLLVANEIGVHSINYRCKDIESLSRKVQKKNSYTALSEITDLAGIRIITLFSSDVDSVATLIEREFLVDRDNSIDKRKAIEPDRFGYLSLHYVLSLNRQRSQLQEYKGLGDLKFEVQIRSILQHTWAEIEHDIGYKSTIEVPKPIRRRFSRLAGLLELADEEFIGIRRDLVEYSLSVKDKVASGAVGVLIDKVSLVSFMENDEDFKEIEKQVFEICRYERGDSEISTTFIKNLAYAKVAEISELKAHLLEYKEEILRRARDVGVVRANKPVDKVSIGISIFFLIQIMVGRTRDKKYISEYIRANDWSSDFGKYLYDF